MSVQTIRKALGELQDEPDNAMAWYYLADAHARSGNDAMAALATAERYYSIRAYAQAVSFAQRAQRKLKEGTNDWQRANDILSIAQIGAAEERKRSRLSHAPLDIRFGN